MPYQTVSAAREDIDSLEGMSDPQVKEFISLVEEEGLAEGEAIPIAISRVKEINKSLNKDEDNNQVSEGS